MVIGVMAALACAACFATASVLQKTAVDQTPRSEQLRPRLLVDLFRRRRWLTGLGASAAGFGLQDLALHFGSLVLVQPLILVELLFALPLAAHLNRRRVRPSQWLSALAVAGGLGLFLTAAAPHGGSSDVPLMTWMMLVGAVGAVVTGCLLAARQLSGVLRTALIATSGGVTFGLLAALLASVTSILARQGVVGALSSWQTYALGVVSPIGEIFAQSAYQNGTLSTSLPILYTLEPASAIAIGIGVFGEQVAHGPALVIAEAAGLVAVVIGVVTLDHESLFATPSPQPLRRVSDRDHSPIGAS